MLALIFFLTLTWQDNSNNEQGFVILRKDPGSSTYNFLTTVKPGTVRYRDQRPKWWEPYCYMVGSFIGDNRSYSNEACNLNSK